MKVTMLQIENQIDETIRATRLFLIGHIETNEFNEIIDKLKDMINAGIKAGLYCKENRIKKKFATLDKLIKPLIKE